MNKSEGRSYGAVALGLALISGLIFAFKALASVSAWLLRFVFGNTEPSAMAAGGPVDAPEQSGRENDRELETASQVERRQKWGTLFVACSFTVGIIAGVVFLFTYWTRANNMALGASLGVCLGAFGFTLVLWAHWLTVHKEATAPREELPSSPDEREATLEDFCNGAKDLRRRRMLKWMGFTGVATLSMMILSLLRSLGFSPDEHLFTRVWQPGQRLVTASGKPITVDALEPGSFVTVFPENSVGEERAQTVLIRVEQHLLDLPEERADWAPMGYVAYSRVCTHAGCAVGLFEKESGLLLCPCHQSTFDVLRAARPTAGPAARPLPQLPLYADSDGTLRAGGGFTAPPGPGFWGM